MRDGRQMKTNPYTVKLPSIGSRSRELEVFARDPTVRRKIAMIPIRIGDEATLKASGLRFRIVTVDEFHQRVEIQLLRNGKRAWIPYAELLLVVSSEGFTPANRTT
jgi:hypothetical protein